jgi:hypothetical protein
MQAIRTATIVFALLAITVNGRAAEFCALFDDLTTLQTAAVQQRLMVSALVCNETSSYNAFVLAHQSELQKSDRDLQDFFTRLNSESGIDDYSAYKTKLANIYSLLSARDKAKYCELTHAALASSQSGDTHSLREFILAQPLMLTIGNRSCGETVAGGTVSIAPNPPAPAYGVRTSASQGAASQNAQQPGQSPVPSWNQRRHQSFDRRTYDRSDYFYWRQSLRSPSGGYLDSFGRR